MPSLYYGSGEKGTIFLFVRKVKISYYLEYVKKIQTLYGIS
jgi:hypothetical protein